VEISVVVASRPNRPPEEDLRVAETADRLGYGEVWVGEGWVWDPFALATAVGLRTERCALTVGPVPVAVRDPVMIAMSTASTAALIGRPVGVALGTSSVRFVEKLHGRERRRPATALAESARAVRSLLSGQHTELQGEVLWTDGYRLRLEPPGGPLTVAAFGDRAVAVAAHADRMVLDLVSPATVMDFRARLDEAAVLAGRKPPRLAAWIPAAVDPDPASYDELMRSLAGYLEVAGYAEVFTRAGFGEAVELAGQGVEPDALVAALPDDAAYRIGIVGDGDTVRARLAAYAEAGLDEVVLVPATAGDPGGERTLSAIADLRDTVP
jgi:probable F420-dependent oxidoreductase